MQTIALNKGTLTLPTSWEELTPPQVEYAFKLLLMLMAGSITPFDFKYDMFVYITGYKPKLFQRKRKSGADFRAVNLANLSSRLDFFFSIKDNEITPTFNFKKNPFPGIASEHPEFTIDVTIETNLTAKQYSDGFDLVQAYRAIENEADKLYCLYKMMSVLYAIDFEHAKKQSPIVAFGVYCWFTSVLSFFQNSHPYSILFLGDKKDDQSEKINFAFNGVIITLEKAGFSYAEDMNLIKFFDTQIIMLKEMVSKAISAGVKVEQLAKQINMPMSIIEKLS